MQVEGGIIGLNTAKFVSVNFAWNINELFGWQHSGIDIQITEIIWVSVKTFLKSIIENCLEISRKSWDKESVELHVLFMTIGIR